MLIITKPQEIIRADFAGQAKPFRAQPEPFAGHSLTFIVVITHAKMFLKVFLCVPQIVLRLCRDHAPDTNRTYRAFCVPKTPSHTRFVVNCERECATQHES